MRKVMMAVAVVVAFLMAGASFAADKDDVLAVVKQCNDAFNKGDAKAAIALATDEMIIIDEFPPYEWHGPGAFAKWFADYDANAKKNGITDGKVTLGKARHVNVAGDRAYAVLNATYTWKEKGKPKKDANATWTFTLLKTKDGWRINGWTWSKP